MAEARLYIKVDRDWLRLAAYTYVLRLIAEDFETPEWERDSDPYSLATAVLRAFGDMEDE